MAERPQHPSGRPIRRTGTKKDAPIWRIPDRGYVTPRLQESQLVGAIGFHVAELPGQQDDDET